MPEFGLTEGPTNEPSLPGFDAAALKEMDLRAGIKFQKLGFRSYAGVMPKVTFEVPFPELAERFTFDRLLTRHDYDIENTALPGNRDITEAHWRKISEGIRHTDRPYLGTITVAMAPEHCEIEEIRQVSDFVTLVILTIRETAPNPIVEDGQHRIKMATHLWPQVKDAEEGEPAQLRDYLERTSVEVTLLLEGDPDTLSTIFVRMGSTKPISPNLIAVMDRSTVQNRLGLYVTRHSRLLADRVSYLSVGAAKNLAARKGRTFEDLYPASAVRSATAAMAGVGVRDRTPEQRENLLSDIVLSRAKADGVSTDAAIELVGRDITSMLDYAYKKMPGWRDLSAERLTVPEFKKRYVHSSAAGLHVIANVIAAGRAQGLAPQLVIEGLAKLPWERDRLIDAKDEKGEPTKVHEFFEGTLTSTSFNAASGQWRASSGGATRSNYETAIDKVLRNLAQMDPVYKPLAERSTAIAIGLISTGRGPGRPRKTKKPA